MAPTAAIKPDNYGELALFMFFWATTFSVLEPLMSVMLFRKRGLATSNPAWAIMCDFFYRSHVLLYPMYVWRYILKRESYFPKKDDVRGLLEFIGIYCAFLLVIDLTWDFISQRTIGLFGRTYLDIFERYSRSTNIASIAGDAAYGSAWIAMTWWSYYNMDALTALSILLFGLLLLVLVAQ